MEIDQKINNFSISEEPYVLLENGKDLLGWDKEKEIVYNQQLRQKAKVDFYRNAFDFISSHHLRGDYWEFGCHKARTFRMALTEARKKNMEYMKFYAFDSFEGLPDSGNNLEHNQAWQAGGLSTTEADFNRIIDEHGIYVKQVKIIKGFYQETLNEKLSMEMRKAGNSRPVLITADCDLYDSFKCVFRFIEAFIEEGTIVYIDDYRASFCGNPQKGAAQAFSEYAKTSKFSFDHFADISWFGKAFITYRGAK